MSLKFAWQQIPSTVVSEILCLNDMDGVVLDTEHGCFSNETLYSCIQIITSKGKQCFVRLTSTEKTPIRYCLDAGADGLIFSTIENEQQIKDITNHCFYPHSTSKDGKRGLGLVRENLWGLAPLLQNKPIVIAQIETKQGVDFIQNMSTHFFDYYLIGPYDLSASLGCAGDFQNSEFIRHISTIQNYVPKSKLGIHIPKDLDQHIFKYRDYGFVALGMDSISILEFHRKAATL